MHAPGSVMDVYEAAFWPFLDRRLVCTVVPNEARLRALQQLSRGRAFRQPGISSRPELATGPRSTKKALMPPVSAQEETAAVPSDVPERPGYPLESPSQGSTFVPADTVDMAHSASCDCATASEQRAVPKQSAPSEPCLARAAPTASDPVDPPQRPRPDGLGSAALGLLGIHCELFLS
ncbi:hypothetical protein PaG_04533 [Moesziomyces aphidis]|jgi:hypothetical protein|uniref:Uncharacterized protein n=1 Tax=Moesziomyces aphidis TaxID=84754 RepID=W3VI45_MOEAP|nr:hypothetical protein PaG_04533 [Moesziomyces aphidis]